MFLSPSLPIQLLPGLHGGAFLIFDVESPSPAMMPVSLSSVIFTVANAQVGEQDSCHE